MNYRLELTPKARRNLKHLPEMVRRRMEQAIDGLVLNPRPHGYKKLAGRDEYRIRVGEYRIIYEIHDHIVLVKILTVGHRGGVYRR